MYCECKCKAINTANLKQMKKVIKCIFSKYILIESRMTYKTHMKVRERKYCQWYIAEINMALSTMDKEESQFIKNLFLHRTGCFVSTTKFYYLLRISGSNFLSLIDTEMLLKEEKQINKHDFRQQLYSEKWQLQH